MISPELSGECTEDTMNALQIKTFLWKNGLTISSIASEIHEELDRTFDGCRNSLTRLFYHGDYNEELARVIKERYGIKVDKPWLPQTVREAVRRAA